MYQVISRYVADKAYGDTKALIAFSGDIEVDGQTYLEAALNGFPESELTRRFDREGWNALVVAEKYLTGFDQPKLAAMYRSSPCSRPCRRSPVTRLCVGRCSGRRSTQRVRLCAE